MKWQTFALAVSASVLAHTPAAAQAEILPSGGLTLVGQTASDERARSELVGSADLFLSVVLRRLRIEAYVEANTTPRRSGVSRLIGEANTDAGTALDSRRRGRAQLSELRLVVPVASIEAHGGLLDATGFLDVSRIANDENLYFLGVPFVNNPTINFPDYALGLAAAGRLPGTDRFEFGAVITSSNGLADNPNVSYAQLLRVIDDEKGVFAGGALRWEGESRRASIGVWVNTADEERLDGSTALEGGAGVFGVVGWFGDQHSFSARVGLADQSVSTLRAFYGATYLWSRRPAAFGAALGQSISSSHVTTLADVTHGELFLRRQVVDGVFLTLSVQRVMNPGLDPTGAIVGPSAWIPGVRVSAQF